MSSTDPQLLQACLRDLQDPRFRTLIIDFDHTLLLGNSTELFIDHARPRGWAWFLSKLGQATARRLFANPVQYNCWRDFFRVSFVLVGLPWSYWRWKTIAPAIGTQRLNQPLYAALQEREDATVIIASLGFRQVLLPLLPARPKSFHLIASSLEFPPTNLRRQGKVAAIEDRQISWDVTLTVTDSVEDLALINRSAKGYQVEWGAEPLLPPAYFPLRFTAEGKFSFKNLVRHHLLIDGLVVLLAYVDGLHSVPLLFLAYFSLFTIYEVGYYENDFRAAGIEDVPWVAPDSGKFKDYSIYRSAWIWASGMLLAMGAAYSWLAALRWLGLLLILRAVFYVYNRLRPAYRVPLYIVLQGVKYFGYALLLIPSGIGLCLVAAQAFRQCLSYVLYRISGIRRRQLPFHLIRLGIFLMLLTGGLLLGGGKFKSEVAAPLGCLIIGWVFYQALKERFGGIGYRVRQMWRWLQG
ncbi:MAG TPA: HAD family hydrolase [Opitutales bacterium]|nr:HAD family hydrolase [Opitutales bacterium]